MFENLSHNSVADQFKRLISRIRPLGSGDIVVLKRSALAAVQAFEACGWHAWLLDEAVQLTPGRFVLLAGGDQIGYEAGVDQPGEVASAILLVLEDYLKKAGCDAPAMPSGQPLFTTAEAADYLDVSPATLRHWVYQSGHLVGVKRGNSLFFYKEELDRVKEHPPQDGRPRTSR